MENRHLTPKILWSSDESNLLPSVLREDILPTVVETDVTQRTVANKDDSNKPTKVTHAFLTQECSDIVTHTLASYLEDVNQSYTDVEVVSNVGSIKGSMIDIVTDDINGDDECNHFSSEDIPSLFPLKNDNDNKIDNDRTSVYSDDDVFLHGITFSCAICNHESFWGQYSVSNHNDSKDKGCPLTSNVHKDKYNAPFNISQHVIL